MKLFRNPEVLTIPNLAAHYAAQQSHAMGRMVSRLDGEEGGKLFEKKPDLPNDSKRCEKLQEEKAEVHGNRTHRTQG